MKDLIITIQRERIIIYNIIRQDITGASRFSYYDCICNPYKKQKKKKGRLTNEIIKESIREM